MRTFTSILEIEQASQSAGGHFFDKAAMRFFSSRVIDQVLYGRYFITSERFDMNTPRYYSIRMIDDDKRIETVSDFQAFKSATQARNWLAKCVAKGAKANV